MPPRPASSTSSGSSSTDSSDSDSSSAVSTPKTAPRAVSGARDAPEDAAAAAVRYMDDDELNDKMRRAQERLKGWTTTSRTCASAPSSTTPCPKGKLPPEQTAAYLEKVKDLEAKRRELLERQMDVGGWRAAAATARSQHRHGGTPRPEREQNGRELVDRLRMKKAPRASGSPRTRAACGWNEADAAHKAAVDRANADAAEAAEAERERERERLQALGRRHVEDSRG